MVQPLVNYHNVIIVKCNYNNLHANMYGCGYRYGIVPGYLVLGLGLGYGISLALVSGLGFGLV